MANSKYEYVRMFEQPIKLLRNTWIVVRVDGHGFHRFTKEHNFTKPNDVRGLRLMNACAAAVMHEWHDVAVAYGQSDEFSFILRPDASIFQRKESKIVSSICSLFSSVFVMKWKEFFGDEMLLKYPPSFDARAVCYPTTDNLKDYLCWRQVDCHINNLYNTAFWALVQNSTSPKTEREAEEILRPTDSAAKNELLFSQFNINYNKIDPMFRRGSLLFWEKEDVEETSTGGEPVVRKRPVLAVRHEDVVNKRFWQQHPTILGRF